MPLYPSKLILYDADGNVISVSNPLPVDATIPAGTAVDSWTHDGTGTEITSTAENSDQALDVHVSNTSIEQTTAAAHSDSSIAVAGKDGAGDVQPLATDTSGNLQVDVLNFPDNEPYNMAQVAGTATSVDSGASDTGTQRVILATDQDTVSTESAQFSLQLDETGVGGITYIGEAGPGTATSSASWRIKRMTETGADITIDWAGGNSNFDNVWDNRASESYS